MAKAKEALAPDYFKLPFEVYYSEHVPMYMMEFKSDIAVNTFSDVKTVHFEQGGSWGVSFACQNNNGPELYCCIFNRHDEVVPEWLEFIDEENIKMNSGADYKVVIEDDEIKFVDFDESDEDEDSEDYVDLSNMDNCCSYTLITYELGESSPDYLILDADNSRIMVSLNGYVLDENFKETSTRIFDPKALEAKEDEFEDYSRLELWEAKSAWVDSILEKDFPSDRHLSLSFDTN